MKIKFIICPSIPENIKGKPFKQNYILQNKSHDWRSAASENYAFEYIGIKKYSTKKMNLSQSMHGRE